MGRIGGVTVQSNTNAACRIGGVTVGVSCGSSGVKNVGRRSFMRVTNKVLCNQLETKPMSVADLVKTISRYIAGEDNNLPYLFHRRYI